MTAPTDAASTGAAPASTSGSAPAAPPVWRKLAGTRYEPPAPRRVLQATAADGVRLHIEEHGPAGAPAVVLAHGWTCSTLFWAPVIRALSDDFRVIAYDQRGHGRSEPGLGHVYSPALLADDLATVLETVLGEGEQAVLVGHSMGGMTLMAAADRPDVLDRAAAVLLVSTGAQELTSRATVVPPGTRPRFLAGAVQRLMLHSGLPLGPVSPITKAALKYAVLSPDADDLQVEATARVVHACPPPVRSGWGHMLSRMNLATHPSRLTPPTAVLVGTGDRLTPPEHAREIAEALPNCVGLIELPGLGHMTPTQAPDAVAAAVRDLARDHLTTTGTQPRPQPQEAQ